MNYVYPLTDSAGRVLDGMAEPNIDSVVLSDGPHGMAWQRYSDGLWYPLRSRKGRTWAEVLRCRNLVLVYDAPPRPVMSRS